MFRRFTMVLGVLCLSFSGVWSVSAQTSVFNMGGTYNQATGTWTGAASLQFVTVGNPGNAADPATGSLYGSVGYTYQMGQYDVTAGQYTALLNAVAATDTYGLYNSGMAVVGTGSYGCGIVQSGSSGSYTYSVATAYQNFPVNCVSWGDAARFCNWLQNGQLTGAEGPGTTETGAYTLNGDTTNYLETRNAGAKYFIPSENEWYKAAYYNPSNGSYWAYPTQSNTAPGNIAARTGTNNANYYFGSATIPTRRTTLRRWALLPTHQGHTARMIWAAMSSSGMRRTLKISTVVCVAAIGTTTPTAWPPPSATTATRRARASS